MTNTDLPGVSAVVLAAGASTRMGEAKQLLSIGAKTLLETVLDNLWRSQVSEIIVVLGTSADEIRLQVQMENVRVVINERHAEGMGTSVSTGIAAVSSLSEGALVILADQPFVRPETFDLLIAQYRERKPSILVPMFQGFRGNPVLIDRHLFPELLSLAGDVGCRAIFGNHPGEMLKVPVDDVGVLLDVDTKADLERFRQIYATGSLGPELLGIADLEGRGERPELVIAGNDQVAKALALFGNALNYTVTIVDPLAQLVDFPGATRVLHVLDLTRLGSDAGTYVVVASRGRFDEEAVEQALNSEARYVALIANKKRAGEIAERLANDKRERLKAPAGLAIGAESPAEIALSVMAEIVSVRHQESREGRTGGRQRP
jgi:molybdenum cofactor cytidylyltransferase